MLVLLFLKFVDPPGRGVGGWVWPDLFFFQQENSPLFLDPPGPRTLFGGPGRTPPQVLERSLDGASIQP